MDLKLSASDTMHSVVMYADAFKSINEQIERTIQAQSDSFNTMIENASKSMNEAIEQLACDLEVVREFKIVDTEKALYSHYRQWVNEAQQSFQKVVDNFGISKFTLHKKNLERLDILKKQSRKVKYGKIEIAILAMEVEFKNLCMSHNFLDNMHSKKIFIKFIELAKHIKQRLVNELRNHFETVRTLFLLILNSIAKTSRTSNAFTIPPIKLFTQTLTRYTHSLSRP